MNVAPNIFICDKRFDRNGNAPLTAGHNNYKAKKEDQTSDKGTINQSSALGGVLKIIQS